MGIAHAIEGWNYKRRAQPNLGAGVTVVWVFQYKVFGSISKPQTSTLAVLVPLKEEA